MATIYCAETSIETPTEKYLGCDGAELEYWLHGSHVYRRGERNVCRLYPSISNRSIGAAYEWNRIPPSPRRVPKAREP